MKRRQFIRALRPVLTALLFLVAGYFILDSVIKKKIRQQFAELSGTLQAQFSKIHTNILSSAVSLDSVDINFIPYQNRHQNKHHLFFAQISFKGIHFLTYLFKKRLDVNNLLVADGNIQLDSFLLEKKDSAQQEALGKIKWPFSKIFIKNVELKKLKVFLLSGSDSQLLAKGDVFLSGASVNKPGSIPGFTEMKLRLSTLSYEVAGYQFKINQLLLNSSRKAIEIDSLNVFSHHQKSEARVSSINISGFDLRELTNSHVCHFKNMVVGDSKIVLNNSKKSGAYALPFGIEKIDAASVQLKNASIFYSNKSNQCRFETTISLNGINFKSPDRDGFHFISVRGNLSNVHYSGNNYYNIGIKNIEIDSRNRLLQIRDINITPQFDKFEFERKLGHQADRVQAEISGINIVKPDFEKLLHQKLFAEAIKIGESNVYIFRDRRLPRSNRNIPLPVEYLKTVSIDIRVKSVEISPSAVMYEEYPKDGYGTTGILKLEKMTVGISPFINHPVSSDPPYTTMIVKGSIMGSGTSRAIIRMPSQKNRPYQIRGVIERLDLTKLNSSSENLGKIRIKSGFLDFLFFDFTMTTQRSTGKIIGAYHHLIIQQLKKHIKKKNVADVASFGLRHVIIPFNKDRSLPERKRTGIVNYQRDPTRMVSYYFLQSLLMGVKKSFTLGFLLPK